MRSALYLFMLTCFMIATNMCKVFNESSRKHMNLTRRFSLTFLSIISGDGRVA